MNNRINVTFYDETYEKLEERMTTNKVKSIAHCIRELVDLGLKVEESARKNTEDQEENNVVTMLIDLKKQMKSNLTWLVETRLLARYIVEYFPNNERAANIEILKKYKETAISHVEKMLLEEED
jgi:hypothetical protein